MKKPTAMSCLLFLSASVFISSCAESPTGPLPPNAGMATGPAMAYPQNQSMGNPTNIPPSFVPNPTQNPNPWNSGGNINWNSNWNSNGIGTSGYQLQAWAALSTNTPSCLPVVYSRSVRQCQAYTVRSRCVTRYRRKRVRLKSCNCIQTVYVAYLDDGTTSEETTLVGGDGSAVTDDAPGATDPARIKPDGTGATPQLVKTSGAAPKDATNNATNKTGNTAGNADVTDPEDSVPQPDAAGSAFHRQALPEFAPFHIEGDDARAIYERMQVEKDKKRDQLRRGPNIECYSQNNGLLSKKYYCTFSVQLVDNNELKMGELLAIPQPGRRADAEKKLDKTYPEKATDFRSVMIRTAGDPLTEIYLNTDPSGGPLSVDNLMAWMPGSESEIQLDDRGELRAKAKATKSLKCYKTFNAGKKNQSKCLITLRVTEGKGVDASLN